MNRLIENFFVVFIAWAGLGFFRGGGEIFKNFSELSSTFFRSIKCIFRALPKHKKSFLGKICALQANFLKNGPKIVNFWESLTKKLRFFHCALSPSKQIQLAPGRFRKILRGCLQKWLSQNSTKGGPSGSAGVRTPEEKGVRPPLNSPLYLGIE